MVMNKKWFSIILCIAMLMYSVIAFGVGNSSNNIIINGGFETGTGTAADGWKINGTWKRVESEDGYTEGCYSLYHAPGGMKYASAIQYISVIPNKIYSLEFDYKINQGSAILKETTETTVEHWLSETDGFKKGRIDFETGESDSLKLDFMDATSDASLEMYLDNVILTLKNPDPVKDTILNPGFEGGYWLRSDYRPNSWITDSNGWFAANKEEAYSGDYSLKITKRAHKEQMGQYIEVDKESTYFLEWFEKGNTDNLKMIVYGIDENGEKTEIKASSPDSDTTEWRNNFLYFYTGEYDNIRIEIFNIENQEDAVYVDDLSLKKEDLKIYVSPEGSDENEGSEEFPLLTLEGAKEKLRLLRETDIRIPAEVIFKGGTYRLETGVDFDAQDSGSENGNVTYKAEDGEKVYFKGSMELDVSKGMHITDEEIKGRMYSDVVDNVLQFDLNDLGFPYQLDVMKNIKYAYSLGGENQYQEYVNLYLDGKAQTIAQWPNGENNFASWAEVVEEGDVQGGTKPGAFRYVEENPSRWVNADNAWIGGFHANEYLYERTTLGSVDSENKIINLAWPASSGVKSTGSRRWKAFNLLEELDVPGEWFIDVNTMILYYYPPRDLEGETLEIAYLNEHMLELENVSYITFEGIEFSQGRRLAFKMTEVSDITIDNCNFINMESSAIVATSTKKAETDKHWWQRQNIDAMYNCNITNCKFYNIGACAVSLDGGNVDTLKKGENKVENCVFSRIALNEKYDATIYVKGCGNSVVNNNISAANDQAIYYFGNDHVIKNNEIYDVVKIFDDAGVIYTGRNYNHRGTEIAYNFIHDVEPVEVYTRGYNPSVYLDDSASGQNVHHNIFVNQRFPVAMCGQMNFFKYNTIVNSSKYGWAFYDDTQTEEREDAFAESAANIYDKDLYFERYPNMDIGYTEEWGHLNAFNEIENNITVNAPAYREGTTINYGTFVNNVKMDSCNDFVDAENNDYRIKSGSETLNEVSGLIDDTFNLDVIGVQNDKVSYNSNTSSFELIYPKDREKLAKSDEITLMWENAEGANEYRVIIATDAEFGNIVFDGTSRYNYLTVTGLENTGEIYYWKVIAENISREYGSEWECEKVFSFKLGNEFEITKYEMRNSDNELIENTENILSDGIINVSAEIINRAYIDGKNANVIFAIYDENNKLYDVHLENKDFEFEKNNAVGFQFKTELKHIKISIMLWDKDMNPILDKVSVVF